MKDPTQAVATKMPCQVAVAMTMVLLGAHLTRADGLERGL